MLARSSRWAFGVVLSLAVGGWSAPKAHAFGAEDPVNGNPFYHESISLAAANDAGWTVGSATPPSRSLTDKLRAGPDVLPAGESIAWHADYIDSYLYNALWWAGGGVDRYKVSLATKPELIKLHFDDLFTTDAVDAMWRRYASGAFAGLVWAKERNDVVSAQHLVGISLHAMQDFYAHSNWIDDPKRRTGLYTSTFPTSRGAVYTGSYETPKRFGVKPHGKFEPSCTVMNQPSVARLLSLGCNELPMMMDEGICQDFRVCQRGETVRPSIEGVKLPPGVMYLAPPGIALDTLYVSDIAVRERRLTDLTGAQAFRLAHDLARTQSKTWLLTLEREMARVPGGAAFWARVKSTPSTEAQRQEKFENYTAFPYQFLSAGPYPPTPAGQDVYLRVRLKTSSTANSGTDADIRLRASGQEFLLDYLPVRGGDALKRVLSYNDFERGDDAVYVVGPFAGLPEKIELYNDSATTAQVADALWKDVRDSFVNAFKKLGGLVKGIIGTDADFVASSSVDWSPKELDPMPYGAAGDRKFTIDLNGGGEGHYRVHGNLRKVGVTGNQDLFVVTLDEFECVRESKWDRGSNSDEPFLLFMLSPYPGEMQSFRTEPWSNVDSGDRRPIKRSFKGVLLYQGAGMLKLSIAAVEHDDESSAARDRLLQSYNGTIQRETETARRSFLDALGAAVAEDWRIEHMEVYAWSRNGAIQTGKVFDKSLNYELAGRRSQSFLLDASMFRASGVKTNDLISPFVQINIIKPSVQDGIRDRLRDILRPQQQSEEPSTKPSRRRPPQPPVDVAKPPIPRVPVLRPVPQPIPRPVPR